MGLSLEDLQKLYPDGRAVRFLSKHGVVDGIVREVVPLPAVADSPDADAPLLDRYGLRVEIERPEGGVESLMIDLSDLEPHGTP